MKSDQFTEVNPDKGTETFLITPEAGDVFPSIGLQKLTPIRGRKL